ncbi:uncharacterized protein RJT20DRAFT_138283 [Scheffersomyces xylosifermentans]|uniref:uncharacterized protein n=1 Tax=Scheffersomyces xylosifermentans TaxID=1304137 RepID=UPI00315D4031
MKLSTTAAQIILAYCALVNTVPVSTGTNTTDITALEASKIQALVAGLNQYNAEHDVPGYTKRNVALRDEFQQLAVRSNIPILDTILLALNDSGLANTVIDFVLLNPSLLDITIDGTIFLAKSGLVNLTDILIALQKSGLILQVINLALDDPEILPGFLRIGKELLSQNGINIFNKRSLDEVSIVESAEFDIVSLEKRESELLNELLTSLRASGLAASVIQHLLTTPELAAPAAHFLNGILHSGALSLSDLLTALKESNLVLNLLRDILNDTELLKKFGAIIVDRIARGIIPRATYDNA